METKKLFRGFRMLFKGYWSSEYKWKACGLFIFVIAMNFETVYLYSQISYLLNMVDNALQDYDSKIFYLLIECFTMLAFCYVFIAAYTTYFQQMLQIKWRTWMTKNYLTTWLSGQTYYRLQDATDNPDQRISEDIGQFVDLSLTLIIGFLKQIATLVTFGIILWELSGSFRIPGTEFVILVYMFWFSFAYSGLGTFFAHKIGRKLIGLNFDQQKYEADFRFSMMRVRENSESIAFYRGESAEFEGFNLKFSAVIKNYWQIMRKTKHLNFYLTSYGQLAIIVPYIMAAPSYFAGELQRGDLTQTAIAFGAVQGALSFFC